MLPNDRRVSRSPDAPFVSAFFAETKFAHRPGWYSLCFVTPFVRAEPQRQDIEFTSHARLFRTVGIRRRRYGSGPRPDHILFADAATPVTAFPAHHCQSPVVDRAATRSQAVLPWGDGYPPRDGRAWHPLDTWWTPPGRRSGFPYTNAAVVHVRVEPASKAALIRINAYPAIKVLGDLGRFCLIFSAGQNRRLSPPLGQNGTCGWVNLRRPPSPPELVAVHRARRVQWCMGSLF
jgi:hypothetical protein